MLGRLCESDKICDEWKGQEGGGGGEREEEPGRGKRGAGEGEEGDASHNGSPGTFEEQPVFMMGSKCSGLFTSLMTR